MYGAKGGILAVRGIKTKIGFNIVLLLLLSAIITDVLVIVVVQNVMIRDEMSRSKRYLENIGNLFFSDPMKPLCRPGYKTFPDRFPYPVPGTHAIGIYTG